MAGKQYSFAIDRGGTFTDVYAKSSDPNEAPIVMKLLSEDPRNYADAPSEAIRRVLNCPSGEKIDASLISSIRMGTTVATNLERVGPPKFEKIPNSGNDFSSLNHTPPDPISVSSFGTQRRENSFGHHQELFRFAEDRQPGQT